MASTTMSKGYRAYRGFVIMDGEQRSKVDSFYSWLHTPGTMFSFQRTDLVSTSLVLSLLKGLYKQKIFWQVKEDTALTLAWRQMLFVCFSELMLRYLDHVRTLSTISRRRMFVRNVINRTLVEYSTLYTLPEFGDEFLKAVLRKQLELMSTEGLLEAFLLFTHLRPDMVNRDCYPIVNYKSSLYAQTAYQYYVNDKLYIQPLQKIINTFS